MSHRKNFGSFKRLFVGILAAMAGAFVPGTIQAALLVDGSIFSDDFPGNAIGGAWTSDGSPEVDGTSSITVAGGLATFTTGAYASIWGSTSMLAGLGSSTDWGAEIKFSVTGNMTTGTGPDRDVFLLSGRRLVGAAGDNAGIDFRLVQDGTGAGGSTYSLAWNGYDDTERASTFLTTLNKGVLYTVSAHRKSNNIVDIYLDGSLISSQAVLGALNPLTVRIGEPAGAVTMDALSIDYVKFGALIPEPGSISLMALAGLGLMVVARRRQKLCR